LLRLLLLDCNFVQFSLPIQLYYFVVMTFFQITNQII
jgi:hypothetical protein